MSERISEELPKFEQLKGFESQSFKTDKSIDMHIKAEEIGDKTPRGIPKPITSSKLLGS